MLPHQSSKDLFFSKSSIRLEKEADLENYSGNVFYDSKYETEEFIQREKLSSIKLDITNWIEKPEVEDYQH
jgi:hypothetical protein